VKLTDCAQQCTSVQWCGWNSIADPEKMAIFSSKKSRIFSSAAGQIAFKVRTTCTARQLKLEFSEFFPPREFFPLSQTMHFNKLFRPRPGSQFISNPTDKINLRPWDIHRHRGMVTPPPPPAPLIKSYTHNFFYLVF
jgi:hypothetical protein